VTKPNARANDSERRSMGSAPEQTMWFVSKVPGIS
jgi:hypothetical protein